MDKKKILSLITIIGAEAIIILAFLLLQDSLTTNILVLNIVVTSLILGLFSFDILIPWIDLNDKSGKKVGSLAVRWFFTGLYTIGAIIVMLVGNVAYEWSFNLQVLIHCGLIFLLFLGIIASLHSSHKVSEVYQQETFSRNNINEMKTAIRLLKNKMNDLENIPINFTSRINTLEEGLRFMSPINNEEAYDLEHSFINILNDISSAMTDFSMGKTEIESNLVKIERIYQRRKNLYSK